jgi:hypothetical protein
MGAQSYEPSSRAKPREGCFGSNSAQMANGFAKRIETGLRDAKRHKLVTRVADIEEKVFGAARD